TSKAPAAAAAPAAGAPAAAAPAAAGKPTAKVKDRRLRYGQPVVVRGRIAAGSAAKVVLEYAPSGRRWRAVERAAVRPDGRYRIAAELRATGRVRVVSQTASAVAAAGAQASRAHRVAVAGELAVKRRSHDAAAGSAVKVRGVLFPRKRGHRVTVEGRIGGRWHAVGHALTRRDGHFAARVVASRLGSTPLRVRSAGTKTNLATRAKAGAVKGYRASLASWYGIYGGPLACGGTLGYSQLGVAHKSLPCGTKVTIRYGGRKVTVPVIDRGPYVGAREWDLTGATARALGFDGVGTVWTTV
ncbi:septal ring lytic transglycosylase RlpA family protein, partial [Conexibacter stalactiti]